MAAAKQDDDWRKQAAIFCGIQASGKSTFCRERFFDTHIRLNLDMLRTRHREGVLLRACIDAKQPFVVDNTNPTRDDRQRYIAPAREAGFLVVGYYFCVSVDEALARNSNRAEADRVPDVAIHATAARLEPPAYDEGFDELYVVRITEDGAFAVEAQPQEPE